MAPRSIVALLLLSLFSADAPAPPANLDAVALSLHRALASSHPGDEALWDFDRWAPQLRALYVIHRDAPLWFDGARSRAATVALLQEIPRLEERGLQSQDYDETWLRALVSNAERTRKPAEIARADLALSVITARLAADLQRGRVTPRQMGYELDLHAAPFDAARAVNALAGSTQLSATLDALEPRLRHYALLKRSLVRYRELARRPELTNLPAPHTTLHLGEPYAGIAALRRLLIALGDLPPVTEAVSRSVFDESTAQGLMHFQRRMGLAVDGALGRATFRALTVPLSQRAQQIVLSLERARWLPALDVPPIIVNIPQFRLFAFRTTEDAARDILQMNVIVGSTFEGRKTPVFAADMTYVVLNPYWDVPASILRKELLREIQADPDWVARNGYEIVAGSGDDARLVPVTPENVAKLAAGKLRLRQVPGPGNTLGRIKFMLPNRHNVYLHDTPTRALFKESRRAFSHGCIRLEDPLALLSHVLRDEPGWNAERIRTALEGPASTRITLSHPIPVFIVYGTALATEAGETLFFEDVYAQDATLSRLLGERGRPSTRVMKITSH